MHGVPSAIMYKLNAEQIMARRNLAILKPMETVESVLKILRSTRHNGFPVVASSSAHGAGRSELTLRGLVLRANLMSLVKQAAEKIQLLKQRDRSLCAKVKELVAEKKKLRAKQQAKKQRKK